MNSLIDLVSKESNVPRSLVESALRNAHSHVKLIKIKKRNGKTRHAFQPSSKLKIVQYWIIDKILDNIAIHECATAFTAGSSIKDNAKRHSLKKYIIKIDLENFFPSIQHEDLFQHIKNWCTQQTNPTLKNTSDVFDLVKKACFFRQGKLPIGYPTSPAIANIVMIDFDKKIESLLIEKYGAGEVIYTRYADDMIFSTNQNGRCKEIENFVKEQISKNISPKIKINSKKTRYMSRNGGSAIVTGIQLRSNATLTLPRVYKDKIRLILSRATAGKPITESKSQIYGHLNHIRDIDPKLFSTLVSKYYSYCKEILPEAKTGIKIND
jgi:RNA-directed DNA polymerase